LTRIIILVLTGLVPTLEDPPGSATRKLGDDGIALVQLCFQALVDVASIFPSIIRADLHACIMHSYCTLLATGICQDEVLPRIMPMFKGFLLDVNQSSSNEVASRLVRGCLHRMLSILTVAQRRENEYAITCAKNTLLSMTILLTTASSVIPASDDLVATSLSELLDCLQDVGLAKIAAGCMRSLLVTSPKTPCDEAVGRTLWTRLVPFVSEPEADDPENVKPSLTQALVAALTTIRSTGRFAAMSILVPLLLLRAQQTSPGVSSEVMRKESAARLLDLVAADQIAFKVTVSLLDEEQRSLLEELLRAAGIGKRQEAAIEESLEAKPAIELRMDFG